MLRTLVLVVVGLQACAIVEAQTATTTTLTSISPAAPIFGQAVTLVATVKPSAAQGFVVFMDGGVLVGVAQLNVSAIAQLTTTFLSAGTHSLRAVYGGSGTAYLASQSSAQSYIVTTLSGTGIGAAVNYGVGSTALSIAVGDFNGDGKADLAVTNWDDNNVSVLLGNGNGTFQPAVNYPADLSPASVAVGDFNGDGEADLVVANNGSSNLSVLLGNGNGTFQSAVNYGAGLNPASVAVVELNGDAKPDLVVANLGNNSVSVLLGNGNGTFQSAVNYGTGSNPRSVAVGDFNGDGQTDLAVANVSGTNVSVLLGNGNGTFQSAVNYGAGLSPASVVVGDLNADGKADLVVANNGSNNVSVLLGNGNGTFQSAVNYGTGSSPISVTMGDFNGDGKTDLAVANYGGTNNVTVLLGNGNGTFQTAVSYGAGVNPAWVAVGEFNGDGRADLAVANAVSKNVSVLLGSGATVGTSTPTPNSGGGSAQVFSETYFAAGGYQDIQWVQMLFATAIDGGGQAFCYVHYDVQGNRFWLYSDILGFFVGPVAPGTGSNLLQGSLCALNTSASNVSGSGNALTVRASVVFKQALALNMYTRAYTLEGVDTGWEQRGTWTAAAASSGTITASPSSGSVINGTQQTFTLTYPDTPGFAGAAFGWEQFLVAVASDGGGQPFCYVHYDRGGNRLWVYSSDVGYFLGPVAPGTASNVLNSSACSVNTESATVQNTGGNLVLSVPLTLKGPMVGSQKLFERALTVLDVDTGFVQTGTLSVN